MDKVKKEVVSLFDDLSSDDKLEIISIVVNDLRRKKEILIPVSIFTSKLGCLEAIVKYLREELKLSNVKVAKLLNRDNKVTWSVYNKAKKKYPSKLNVKSDVFIPVDVFSDRKYSILESLVGYLKDNEELRFVDISKLINRDQRTIWVVYQKYKKKVVK